MANATETEKVMVFACRCPLGDQCSKKSSLLQRKLSEADARSAVEWHLQHSPDHALGEIEACSVAETADLEQWEEEKW
eukprot:6406060-Alexandrium_andersonii.AAC.1